MVRYPVAERFISINGEGRKAGTLACFIRLRGCNLKCSYCDTRWACEPDAEAEWLTEEEIAEWVQASGICNVTLTGGEPLTTPEADRLLLRLAALPGVEVEVETNGSIPLASYIALSESVFYTMDLKCPGSGMADHNCMDNLSLLRPQDVLKFVVSDIHDLDWMREIIDTYRLTEKCGIYTGAVFGRITPEEIVGYKTHSH